MLIVDLLMKQILLMFHRTLISLIALYHIAIFEIIQQFPSKV